MTALVRAAWLKVHQPRVIAITYTAAYTVLTYAGVTALIDPPTSLEGAVGALSMGTLAALLVLGGALGAPSALLGLWWLERVAVIAVSISAGIYGGIILTLHMIGTGNRQLQLGFVLFVLLMQLIRWHRIRERPYDPARHV